MKQSPCVSDVPRGAVLAGALAVGIAGDVFLRPSEGPGLNLFLMFIVLAVAILAVSRRAGLRPSGEAYAWMTCGLLLSSMLVIRAAPGLQFLAFMAASAAFAMPALRAGARWLRGSGVSDHLEAIGSAILHAGLGALRLLADGTTDRTPRRRGWAILRGLLFAVPVLLVFGALFVSADPVFAGIVSDSFQVLDLGALLSRLALIGGLTWLASGYLAGFVTGTRVRGWLEPVRFRPSIGILEAGTVLGLVNLLFAAFVLVQVRYLFGGSGVVEVTPGLTYSAYAREGFAQLVMASGLVLPGLLLFDWLLRRERPRDEWIFRVLGGLQLLLLLVVIASAFQRVQVYQEAYGLTGSRFYGGAFLVWLTLLAIWFAATILRGRSERFAPTALVSGFVFVAVLLAINPDDRIARENLTRVGEPTPEVDFDAAYLASLSADAIPALITALPGLPPEARCTMARELQRRWGIEATVDWRSWNLSEARARRLVRAAPIEVLSTANCTDMEGSSE